MAPRDETDVPTPRGRGAAASSSDLRDPELDQGPGRLGGRAGEDTITQARLRGLVRANQLVSSELTCSAVLRRTVDTARELVGAGCATVVLGGPGGSRVESIQAMGGPRSSAAAAVGQPSGRAVATAGPPVAELAVPIRVHGEEAGELRLIDSARGGFDTEDRELAKALATTAGLAIGNARRYEIARRRGQWLEASAAITRQLLSGDEGGRQPLELIARSSRDLAGADVVAVLRPDREGAAAASLCVEVLVGPDDVGPAGRFVPLEDPLLGRVFTEGRPICLTGAENHRLGPVPWARLELGAVLAAPLVGSRRTHGVLLAARLPGRPDFAPTDLELAASFANQAGVTIELADARAEQQRAALLDQRERIAADLHDTVVQRLFSVGLSLQGVLAEIGDGRAGERLRATVDEVDRTINRIRSALFPPQAGASPVSPDPRDLVLDAVAELVPALGVEPDLRFSGLLLGRMSPDLAEDLVAVVRGALLDVARRGRATTVSVDLLQDRDGLVVHVRDDDPEGGGAATGEAAADLRRRAERHGGMLTVSAGTPAGTSLYWWAPRP